MFSLLLSRDADTHSTLPHYIQIRVLTPKTSLKVIDLIERILFPLDGYPAPTPLDPTPEETIIMRKQLERRIDSLIPGMSPVVCWDTDKLMSRNDWWNVVSRWSCFYA
jgi:hypothetical protein